MPSTPQTALTLPRQDLQRRLKRLDRMAHVMDDQFRIPVLNVRVGLDPIVGLIPGAGDWISWGVSVLIFWQAHKLGVPARTLLRMAGNIGVDLITGYVPGVGDAFDVLFKANKRNVELVHAHFGGAAQLGAQLPATLPERALAPRSGIGRTSFALALIFGLLVLATLPALGLYYLFIAP